MVVRRQQNQCEDLVQTSWCMYNFSAQLKWWNESANASRPHTNRLENEEKWLIRETHYYLSPTQYPIMTLANCFLLCSFFALFTALIQNFLCNAPIIPIVKYCDSVINRSDGIKDGVDWPF